MLCIVGTRRSGKTVQLIKLSEITGIPIVTHSRQMVDHVENQAAVMGCEIPTPQVLQFSPADCGRKCDRVYIDDARAILEQVAKAPVEIVTFDAERFDFSTMSLIELFAAWWRSRRVKKIDEIEASEVSLDE